MRICQRSLLENFCSFSSLYVSCLFWLARQVPFTTHGGQFNARTELSNIDHDRVICYVQIAVFPKSQWAPRKGLTKYLDMSHADIQKGIGVRLFLHRLPHSATRREVTAIKIGEQKVNVIGLLLQTEVWLQR